MSTNQPGTVCKIFLRIHPNGWWLVKSASFSKLIFFFNANPYSYVHLYVQRATVLARHNISKDVEVEISDDLIFSEIDWFET